MKRTICDFCGETIAQDTEFSIGIFDVDKDRSVLDLDACQKCADRIKKALRFLRKKKR
jgi:ribosomal protein L24E